MPAVTYMSHVLGLWQVRAWEDLATLPLLIKSTGWSWLRETDYPGHGGELAFKSLPFGLLSLEMLKNLSASESFAPDLGALTLNAAEGSVPIRPLDARAPRSPRSPPL